MKNQFNKTKATNKTKNNNKNNNYMKTEWIKKY